MKTLVKPIRNEENPLVEGYCENGSCTPQCRDACYQGGCSPFGDTNDTINEGSEILF